MSLCWSQHHWFQIAPWARGSVTAKQNSLRAALVDSSPAKQWKGGKKNPKKVLVVMPGTERFGSNPKLGRIWFLLVGKTVSISSFLCFSGKLGLKMQG